MNKKILILVLAVLSVASLSTSASAHSVSDTEVTSASSAKLLERIAELQAQIRLLTQKNEELAKKLELARQLKVGAKGDDVQTLQKILATDRAIYPEGLATGFFGEKTKEAIKRLQEKFGLPVTGEIDEKTKELINKILTSQGVSKDIPPGLLVAPGLKDRVRVKLENKEGRYEYRIETNDDSSEDGDSELEVEIENKSNDRSRVKIDWKHDGKRFKRVLFLNTQNETEIIEKVANLLNLSKDEVKAAISSDDSDDSGDDDGDHDDSHGSDDSDDDED